MIVVSRALARSEWPGETAIGKRIKWMGAWRTVVGVVGDIKIEDDVQPARPGRLVPVAVPARRREGEGRPPRPRCRRAFAPSRKGFDRLLIGAPDELAGELEHKLHSYLRERIAGRLHLDVENSGIEGTSVAATEKAIEDWTRRCEREALDRLTEGVGRGGAAPPGSLVLEALNEQRVEILLVADGFRSPGGRDAETACSTPATTGRRTRSSSAARTSSSTAIEKAIEQSAKVIKVSHHDDLGPLGGIGAVLRY